MTPQELKNSVLQLAIQGRLVEQRPKQCGGKFRCKSDINLYFQHAAIERRFYNRFRY